MNPRDILETLCRAFIGTILDRFGKGKKERKKVDKKLYEEITVKISPEFMRDFFSELGISQLWNWQFERLADYRQFSSTPGKRFLDKKIQKVKKAFDKSLGELWEFLLTDFFMPNNREDIFFLQPELKKRTWNHKSTMHYRELSQQLRILQKNTERSYESFIRIVQKRLYI